MSLVFGEREICDIVKYQAPVSHARSGQLQVCNLRRHLDSAWPRAGVGVVDGVVILAVLVEGLVERPLQNKEQTCERVR